MVIRGSGRRILPFSVKTQGRRTREGIWEYETHPLYTSKTQGRHTQGEDENMSPPPTYTSKTEAQCTKGVERIWKFLTKLDKNVWLLQVKKRNFFWFLRGLHKLCSHITARSDLLIDLSTRVECLSRDLVSHTCTHRGTISWNDSRCLLKYLGW